MKSLVIFSSQTGNTRKLAEVVFKNLPEEKELCPVSNAPDPAGYDLIAVGFWLMSGKPDPETLKYLQRTGAKKLILFGTHGVPKGSPEAQAAMNYAKQLAPEAEVIGTYSCQGELSPQMLEMGSKTPNPPPWLKDPSVNKGHPDDTDINELKEVVAKAIKKL